MSDEQQHIKIAISGKSGCGNSTTSRRVAALLGFPMINYTFHTIADEKNMDFQEVCRLAEEDTSWDLHVDRRQVEMANEAGSCVLGSRLAIWILEEADLTVYLTAPKHVRSERIHKREGGDLKQVARETEERDRRDHERYLRLYGIDNDDYAFCDLIIDTTNLLPQAVADHIVKEVHRRFSIPGSSENGNT